jgi:hypothetical protein
VLVAHTGNPSYSGAEIKRITVQSQSRKIVFESLPRKKITKRSVGVVQSIGPEFEP